MGPLPTEFAISEPVYVGAYEPFSPIAIVTYPLTYALLAAPTANTRGILSIKSVRAPSPVAQLRGAKSNA